MGCIDRQRRRDSLRHRSECSHADRPRCDDIYIDWFVAHEDQVMIGLPSSPQGAGSGYTPPAEVAEAINYLVRGRS
jgi:hypothetical protein